MNRLLIRKYELNLKIEKKFLFIKYSKNITLKFEQAKIIDIIEFLKINNEWKLWIISWLLWFIKDKSDKNLNSKDRIAIIKDWEKVYNKIKETFFEWYFKDIESNIKDESPFSSSIMIICEKLWVEPLFVVNNYTQWHVEFIAEWLLWNTNWQTKEWQKKNKLRLRQQKALNRTDEENEKIKKILSTFKK